MGSHSLLRGFLQPTILEWIAYPFYSGSSQPRSWTRVSRTAGRFFTCWSTREALLPKTTSNSYNSFFLLVSSDAQTWATLCNCMDCSMPGFPVHHQLPELAQIHVHRVGDSIQPTYPLSSPYPSYTGWSKPTFWFSYWNGPPLKCFSSVQLLSHVQLFATPWTAACQASLSITNSQNLLRLRSIISVRPSKQLMLCRPLPRPPSIFPSIRVFSCGSVLHIRWPRYWSFSFSISLSNEYLGLISFRIDWLDFLAVQGTFKSLLQHHSSKASILRCSAFFIVHISHPYMTTGKTIALIRQTFVGKIMSLLFICCLGWS